MVAVAVHASFPKQTHQVEFALSTHFVQRCDQDLILKE